MPITKIDLNTLSLTQLAAVYNSLSDEDMQIKKFADRAAATKRVARRLADSVSVLVDSPLGSSDLEVEGVGHIVTNAAFTAAEAAAPAPAPKKSRAIFGEDETIEINVTVTHVENADGTRTYTKHNPKRKGSKAAARLQLLIDAGQMTVGEYLDACVALEGDDAEDRFKYRRDVAWDIEHGFIVFPNGASED